MNARRKLFFFGKGGGAAPVETRFTMLIDTEADGVSGANQFTLVGAEGTYNLTARNVATEVEQVFENQTGEQTFTFSEGAGQYLIFIEPTGATPFHRIVYSTAEIRKIIDIQRWGNVVWSNFANMFNSVGHTLKISATDAPDLTTADISFSGAFRSIIFPDAHSSDFSHWDFSNVRVFLDTFRASTFASECLIELKVDNSFLDRTFRQSTFQNNADYTNSLIFMMKKCVENDGPVDAAILQLSVSVAEFDNSLPTGLPAPLDTAGALRNHVTNTVDNGGYGWTMSGDTRIN